jgi:hypothetical protein
MVILTQIEHDIAQSTLYLKTAQYQLIRANRPDNKWLSTPLRGLDNAELSGTRLKRSVNAPLRYATTKRSSRQITSIIGS